MNSERGKAAYSLPMELLLIQVEQQRPVYTDEILRHAGFQVRALSPKDALTHLDAGAQTLAVLSNTLTAMEASELALRLRLKNPEWKLLAILGSDAQLVDHALFDRAVDGLEGPRVLIRAVRELAATLSEMQA